LALCPNHHGALHLAVTKEPDTSRLLLEKLKLEDGHAIVIGSDIEDERREELIAKSWSIGAI
jgi:hypothetical protein